MGNESRNGGIEMIVILIAIAAAALAMIIMIFCFQCYIEDKSEKLEPHHAFGKTYFFMTQDQIQNACKSIILMEKHAEIKPNDK